MLGSLAGLAGICVGTYLVFLALDKLAQQKEKGLEEHECHCNDIDGDCHRDCCGCHGCCCHKDDDDKK